MPEERSEALEGVKGVKGVKDDELIGHSEEGIHCRCSDVKRATQALPLQTPSARIFPKHLTTHEAVATGSPLPLAASRSTARGRRIARWCGWPRGRPGSPARPG